MPQPLPDDFFTQVSDLLIPFMNTHEERDAYLSEAFYISDRRITSNIDYNGTAKIFTVRCIKTLLDRECFPSGKHYLSALLNAIRSECGVEKQAKIDTLIAILNDQCSRPEPSPSPLPPTTPLTPAPPPQTLATPEAQRTPTIFISYSRRDSKFVEQLIRDLQAAGHSCWLDTTDIKGGDEWVRAISEGINNSYAFITAVSESANASKWVQREFMWAESKDKRIIPVIIEPCELPIYMMDRNALRLHPDYAAGLAKLVASLPTPTIAAVEGITRGVSSPNPPTQRALELEYLDRLRAEEWLIRAEKYTTMAGTAQITKAHEVGEPVGIRPEFEYLRRQVEEKFVQREQETKKYGDILAAIADIRRAALLGEPGAGKSTTLWRLTRTMVGAALDNAAAPIPILIRLGKWTQADQPLTTFIAGEMGGLGAHLETLLTSKRAALFLDGLNEIPVAQREQKSKQVKALFDTHRDVITVVSCRAQDYTLDLGIDRIVITPLDALRIREFVTRYMGEIVGDNIFWQLAGGESVHHVFEKWQSSGATFELFFSATEVPRGNPNVYGITSGTDDDLWRNRVRNIQGSLLGLAQNPYMLLMLVEVYQQTHDLPQNRGQLFSSFVETLLVRENIATRNTSGTAVLTPEATRLLTALSKLAYEMQVRRAQDEEGSAVTSLSRAEVVPALMDDRLLYLASSTNLLAVSEAIRFSHQLLQEYFAATYMKTEIEAVRLKATDIWKPKQWWERTNWEEATILLAGLYSDDCTPVLDWIGDVNPEVAAQCIVRSGANTPIDVRHQWRDRWLPRLTDTKRDPEPKARAAVGRALGWTGDDNRPGVGLTSDGLPDIVWCEVPAGEFIYQQNERKSLPRFYMAKYPITFRQYQAFVDTPDGYANAAWWDGLAQRQPEPGEQSFKYWNHPRDDVSWLDAMAFCRWLNNQWKEGRLKLPNIIPANYEIRLPTEIEWEKAARGVDGREYPYQGKYDPKKGNTVDTKIEMTSAVGIFPDGKSPYGILDMSGNVLEWTLTEIKSKKNNDLSNDERRVLRGGSWNYDVNFARAADRDLNLGPDDRRSFIGFRVVCGVPTANL